MLQVWVQTQMSSNFIHNKVFTWVAVVVLIMFLPYWHVWIFFGCSEVCYITLEASFAFLCYLMQESVKPAAALLLWFCICVVHAVLQDSVYSENANSQSCIASV